MWCHTSLAVIAFISTAFVQVSLAQEGSRSSIGTASNPFAGYSCDSNACKLPACKCATMSPPIENPPQFVVVTFDDSVQASVWPQANALFKNRKNPNGCPALGTWFAQVYYSDPILLTQWYAAGNEIADHTVTHVPPFTGTYAEIEGMRAWATSYAGIPRGKIQGVRFPFLNYTANALSMIQKMGFTYDSSMSALDTDSVWPYTLDNGPVNDCSGQIDLCSTGFKAPGLWEVPLYGISVDGAHLMDPYNDFNIANPVPVATIEADYKATFDRHYSGNRAPFGIYTHPVWIGPANPPAIPDGTGKLAMLQNVLNYVMSKPDTWMVTTSQLIAYSKNPVPASQLGAQPYMQCTPNPAPPTNICNGMSVAGADVCNLPNGTFSSCYGCPSAYPDLGNPSPSRTGSKCPVPDTCDTLWWDPVGCKCLCTVSACAWNDTSRSINLDPASLNNVVSGSGNGGRLH
ncbi:hypothetical protein BATDEDRAFT_10655 [Batrachochytrium dendrobatidis JAM81]|uniref:NodB homology domain-containing protein n=1 Tax=Batrachochytrium dendrobatidis (strain JAM81 / FGSC 10211) TaxID=684364 RepID=F4NZM8_BATDJ|nr:uncharacterized protein BATDEDRAFT_10655 [Batrachochytrium dendrobatidis JAM81]EGF81519.1 hypothetical protein BATDEDRAFT_10655 [Batrachochytrium dendrobatidis JAM81]|eukprot:XP_006677748.1 hypothetical protein BATDEDRAFT_10655 [Batrachochytrium dendrobatidis JAM81]